MVINADALQQDLSAQNEIDGPMFKMDNDPRLTRAGHVLRKLSLDELPQLVNVLKGEMSMVGPRPLSKAEMKFNPVWRDIRLTVRPGITGQWQVNERSSGFFKDWIKHDIFYVNNRSLWLDLKILLKTIGVVFNSKGAF